MPNFLRVASIAIISITVAVIIIGPSSIGSFLKPKKINGIYSVDPAANTNGTYRTIRYNQSDDMVRARFFKNGIHFKDMTMFMGFYPTDYLPSWYGENAEFDYNKKKIASLFPLIAGKETEFNTTDFSESSVNGVQLNCTLSQIKIIDQSKGTRADQKWDIYQIQILRSHAIKIEQGNDGEGYGSEYAVRVIELTEDITGKENPTIADAYRLKDVANSVMAKMNASILERVNRIKSRQTKDPQYDPCTSPEFKLAQNQGGYAMEEVIVWFDAIHNIPVGLKSGKKFDFSAAGFLQEGSARSKYLDEVKDINKWN
jgi:hypothetical protein